jgi:hypothetical protein
MLRLFNITSRRIFLSLLKIIDGYMGSDIYLVRHATIP